MTTSNGKVTYWAYKTPMRKTVIPALPIPPKPAEESHPNCIGCHWGGDSHPSQRYHMQPGGCLYDVPFDEPSGKVEEQ